ncbi:hypothetical protein D3C87_71500 [compost metagenome]|uniref:metallophosphoesterase family protein n=1 Tax=unclassified Flavobacterium TaxID=196869 RepID=UPI000FC1AFFB|nr:MULTISPECIES: metallophosphoesterase family protein [unclassified Flavobacterium]WDO13480.1 metallophosphoesterase family protein [Flavobacterium sp. WW92]
MKSNNLWFTSDHHFGHKNVIEFSKRPFQNVEEMNFEMIQRWNQKVKQDDIVYHIGDFGLTSRSKLKEILSQLNGKIHLVTGNHETSARECAEYFESIQDYCELIIEDVDAFKGQRLLVLFHYAMRVWNASHYGSWHLYGHTHGELPDDNTSLSFDVGVDCHNFYPISYQEVKGIMSKKNWTPPFAPRENK